MENKEISSSDSNNGASDPETSKSCENDSTDTPSIKKHIRYLFRTDNENTQDARKLFKAPYAVSYYKEIPENNSMKTATEKTTADDKHYLMQTDEELERNETHVVSEVPDKRKHDKEVAGSSQCQRSEVADNNSFINLREFNQDLRLLKSTFQFGNITYHVISSVYNDTNTFSRTGVVISQPNETANVVGIARSLSDNSENIFKWGYFTMVTVTRPTKLGEKLSFLIQQDEQMQTLSEQMEKFSVGDGTVEISDMWWYGMHIYLNKLQGEICNQRYEKIYMKYVTPPNYPTSDFIKQVTNGEIKTYTGTLSEAPSNRVMNNIRLLKHDVCIKTDVTKSINFADFEYEDFDTNASEIQKPSFRDVLATFKDIYPSKTFDLIVYQFKKKYIPRILNESESANASVSMIDMDNINVYFAPTMAICKNCWKIMDDSSGRI